MSIVISDQLQLSNLTSLEPRESNVVITGNIIKVENRWEYLARVDLNSRYVGLEVVFLEPTGSYPVNLFSQYCQNGTIHGKKYYFKNISDTGFITYNTEAINIVDDLVTGGSYSALSAEQGVVLRELIENKTVIGSVDMPASYENQKDKILVVNETETGLKFVARTHVHDQGLPSSEWSISHGLDKFPSLVIKTSAGDSVEGSINYVDKNTIIVTFNAPFSGTAVLN